MTRSPKKSDWLEVRLTHDAKRALMDRSRAEGRPASAVVRALIDGYVATPAKRHLRLHLALAATAVVAAGAIAAPSMARPSLHSAFTLRDANHDGVLSRAEFEQGAEVTAVVRIGGAGVAQPMGPSARLALADAAFSRIDADHDGVIAFSEFRRAYGR